MAENQTPANQNSSDEIDLGQLFQLIGRGFNALFRLFLRIFLYFKKNIFILIGLVVLGLAMGYGLSQIITNRIKTEVIVKPQMDSKNYLYDVIYEIQANIDAKDSIFFKSIGIKEIDFNGLEVTIDKVTEELESESDMQYLEFLQSFENMDAIADIVRAELQNKSSFNHRVTFYYKNAELGNIFSNKVMTYINSNPYFDGLIEIYRSNATSRIEQNQVLLKQVDEIITNYANNMSKEDSPSGNERILLDNKETVNITGLFSLKNELIRDIEAKQIELKERTEPLKVINFGKPQQVQKSIFGKKIILVPGVLVLLFFLISFLKFLNKKTKELN